ncbi:MAG: lytic murein transglycosylase [Maricaulaceae bacterium]
MRKASNLLASLMLPRNITPLLFTALIAMPACASSPSTDAQAQVSSPQAATQNTAQSRPSLSQSPLSQSQRFENWKTDFISRAVAKGYSRTLVTRLIQPAQINERALDRDRAQPEFSKPIWSYVESAASTSRLESGKAKLREHTQVFQDVEGRYRVSPYVLTAIWGLETSYGRIMGNHDIISALSTFAFEGRRSQFGEAQLFAVLDIVRSGAVRPDQLTGSWAGAMGMTQFIPATFRDYAVDFNGDGNKDLWGSEADALGSAAHYLSRFGWRGDEPIYAEVKLPSGFDYAQSDGRKKNINEWTAQGVAPINGQRWSTDAGFLDAKLLVPAGAKGPIFLTFKNFDVIKKYNNSTSYALGIGVLSEALRGKKAITKAWPRSDKPVGRSDLKRMQEKLTALGYDTKGADGIVGPNTRRAIRAWQSTKGLAADGYIEQKLFKRIMDSR